VCTFQTLCARLLRATARDIGLPPRFAVCQENEGLALAAWAFDARGQAAQDVYAAIVNAKVEAAPDDVSLEFPSPDVAARVFARLGSADRARRALAYQQALAGRGALDFGDLAYYTRAMLAQPDIRRRWEARFDFVQVDGMQDLHPSEYEIARLLAQRSGNLALFGDPAQAIDGWRGSQPERVVAQFEQDFRPSRLPLAESYRATRVLLQAADSFARNCGGFGGRYAGLLPAAECLPGTPIEIAARRDAAGEAVWIADRLRTLSHTTRHLPGPAGEEFAFARAAVLTRTADRAAAMRAVIAGRRADQVTVCAARQAAGLEFDYVFIAGAVDGEFPSPGAPGEDRRERARQEEQLFHVAMTRARKRLFISCHTVNAQGGDKRHSPYLDLIDPAYCAEV
jgi:DNA helicase-2/ATP-dependent DNA helicase PcrA